MKRVIILGLMAMSLMACCAKKENNAAKADGTTAAKATNQIKELKSGPHGGRETASNEVIKSQDELNKLYRELGWDNAPQVDFSANNVVALFMGLKNSGGHMIGIENVYVKGGVATVKIVRTVPEGMATTVMTQPYYVAAITKTDEVVFE